MSDSVRVLSEESVVVSILDTIDSPGDLKKLSFNQLEQLAAEIRIRMVDTVTQTGGVAPNIAPKPP